MNVRFVRGGEVKPSNIGIGKYKGLLGLPREMQEVVLLLRKLGYFSEENEEQLQTGRFDNEDIRNFFYDYQNNPKYTYSWKGAKLLWDSLFWIKEESAHNFYMNLPEDIYLPDQLSTEISLSISKIDPNSEVAKMQGGSINADFTIRIYRDDRNETENETPESYKKEGIKSDEELISFLTKKFRDLPIYIKAFLKKYHHDDLNESRFERGIDPKKSMDIGLSRYENTWNRINPGETRYSPEEALQYLRKSSLKPYIVQGLSRQPDWTIDYQVKMINYLITHGNFAPFPEIRPDRELPALTMRRIFDELEKRGVLEFDRSRRPHIVYLKTPEVNESVNFERGLDPKASMGIGKAANPLIITSVEEEYWEGGRVQSNKDVEKADQNTWMNPIDDPVEIDYLFNNWEKTIDPFYGFWYQDPDDEEEYIWAHPSELEGEWVEWSGNKYYIPKTNIFKKIGEVVESVNFERGLDPKDSLKIGHYHNRMLEKAREELKNIFDDIQKKYGGKIDVRKATFLLQTGIRATWIPPTSPYNYGIEFFESKDDNQYYFTPIKWNKPGKPFANLNYGGRKSAREAANEMIAQWGGKIDESLNFERGLDPKASMDMGTKNRILNKLKSIFYNEIDLGSKREMQTLWGFYPKGEDYYIFSSVYPQNWIEDILKDYGIDEFLEFPGKYEEKRSAVYKIKYKIKEPFKEYFKNIGASGQHFVSESVNFERGIEPKKAMNIGKNKNNFFATIPSMPFIKACETYPWFENMFAGKQKDLLTAAAKMLQVPEQKVGVGIRPDNTKDTPLDPNDSLLDQYIERDDWQYDKEDEVGDFELIGSTSGEIYIKDQETEDILGILGAIY